MISIKYGTKQHMLSGNNFHLINSANVLRTKSLNNDFVSQLSNIIPKITGAKVHIVISDKTRLCEYPRYLPKLTQYLLNLGYATENIIFYIAYGTHPKQSEKESAAAYGQTYSKFRFIHHYSGPGTAFQNYGTTSQGTKAIIRKDIFECDLLITFGAISHHYFAGFGGGRKLLFPGLAEQSSIYHNHSLFLEFDKNRLNPDCQSGKLKGNRVAEDLKEIDQMFPEKVSIHSVLDAHGKVIQMFLGKDYQTFLNACTYYTVLYGISTQKEYNIVLASCGGFPKDINFIQAHKSIHNAAGFVKDGGTLIIFAECIDGIGNDSFLDFFGCGNKKELFDYLRTNYSGNAGTALSMMEKSARISIRIVTNLNEKVCDAMGMKKTTIDEVHNYLSGKEDEVVIIQNASLFFQKSHK